MRDVVRSGAVKERAEIVLDKIRHRFPWLDCLRAGLEPAEIAPLILNTLRWCWRRSVLDRDDDPGRQRGLTEARKRQARIGPTPADYSYNPPPSIFASKRAPARNGL